MALTEIKVTEYPDCDYHRYVLKSDLVEARYDARTKDGTWGFLCEECFDEHGIGLGTGLGQRLVKRKAK